LVAADMIQILGLNMTSADLKTLAQRHDVLVFENLNTMTGKSPALMVGDHPQEEDVKAAFQAPFRGFFEPCSPGEAVPEILIDCLKNNGLAVSLSTRSAFSCHIAHHLCDAIFSEITIAAEHADGIRFALEEAISNAILHGNLQVNGALRNNLDDFERYTLMIDERLSNATYGMRRLLVLSQWDDETLTFTIQDEGEGYKAPVVEKGKPSGRGLQIITSVATSVNWLNDGRRFIMSFDY